MDQLRQVTLRYVLYCSKIVILAMRNSVNIGKIKKTKKTNCLEIKKTINVILNKSQCTLFKDRYNI